jgi:hypothetical protein
MTHLDPRDPAAILRSWLVRLAVVRALWRLWFGPLAGLIVTAWGISVPYVFATGTSA